MGSHRTPHAAEGALDVGFQPNAVSTASRFKFERVELDLDQNYFKNYWDPLPYQVNKIVLGTARDNPGETGFVYILNLNNADLYYPSKNLLVDASALQGADFSGEEPFFGDAAIISTTHVTTMDAHIKTGGGNNSVSSGIGSDWISTGAGDDFASIGSGVDTVYTGIGNDYIESTYGDFNALDRIYAGDGDDEVSFYAQDIHDADLVQVRSVEVLGLSQNGDLELNGEAQRVGIRELFVDDTAHAITVGSAFTRALTINMTGNFANQVSIDASASRATLTVHAEYAPAELVRDFHGGTGSQDTLWVSAGFSGVPLYGANLTQVTGFEHIVVDGGFDVGGLVTLATKVGDINAAFQTVDAHTLGEGSPLTLRAQGATAALHVVASSGDDIIATGSGDDRMEGGLGADRLSGHGGHDTFIYNRVADSSGATIDAVLRFQSGRDAVDVTGLGDDQSSLHGQAISFFGNQQGGSADDTAFAATAGNGALDAVFRADTHTLWFDTNDDGKLDGGDLHLVLASVDRLQGADVLAGHVIV